MYLHGVADYLTFYYDLNYDADAIEENIEEIKIYGDIYLFSCKGGREDLASTMASATNCNVIASVHKVSFDDGRARCSWEWYAREAITKGIISWRVFSPDGSIEPYSYFFVNTK